MNLAFPLISGFCIIVVVFLPRKNIAMTCSIKRNGCTKNKTKQNNNKKNRLNNPNFLSTSERQYAI